MKTVEPVHFYESEFYPLSNFSSFMVEIWGEIFPSSEYAYQWIKFVHRPDIQKKILDARSSHSAQKIAHKYEEFVREDWKDIRVERMEAIITAKAEQHDYVRRKLLQTGEREIIENSHRDSFWGWGSDQKGENQLGKLWMKVRKKFPEFLTL